VSLVIASLSSYRPPVSPDLIRLLTDEYQGRSIVGPGIIPELAFALTGGRAASTGGPTSSAGFPVMKADLVQLNSMPDADGKILLLCLDPVYQEHWSAPSLRTVRHSWPNWDHRFERSPPPCQAGRSCAFVLWHDVDSGDALEAHSLSDLTR
jgi:hypothetical protein